MSSSDGCRIAKFIFYSILLTMGTISVVKGTMDAFCETETEKIETKNEWIKWFLLILAVMFILATQVRKCLVKC